MPVGPDVITRAAYVHVPFCVHRCGYCDFTVVAGRDDLMHAYLDAIECELRRELKSPRPVSTLFIGGGTPTYLPVPALERLLSLLQAWLPLEVGAEFSVEANPAGFDRSRMDVLQQFGVNRISLGVQAFQQETLQVLERDHSPQDVARVVDQLRQAGFANAAIDLIYGVPGQSLEDWNASLAATLALNPQHVSTYGLTFEKGTTFWGRLNKGDLKRADEELEREMYSQGMQQLPAAGLNQYELSNFARPGFECRHNQTYWRAEPYFGFGPGAAGFDGRQRHLNHRSVTTWIRRVLNGESGIMESETLDADLAAREAVMLGLRQVQGIDRSHYQSRFGRDVRELSPIAFDQFVATGWLEATDQSIRLTREGRFVADTVMSEFLVP